MFDLERDVVLYSIRSVSIEGTNPVYGGDEGEETKRMVSDVNTDSGDRDHPSGRD